MLTKAQRDALARASMYNGIMTFDDDHRIGQELYARGVLDAAAQLTPFGLAVRQAILEEYPDAGH